MQDILMELLGIFLAVILLFIFPIMEITSRSDELSETAVQIITAEFVSNVSKERKNYDE